MNSFTIKDGNYYVLGNGLGNDSNPGTIDAPRATFGSADELDNKNAVLRGTVEQNIILDKYVTLFSLRGDAGAVIKGVINREIWSPAGNALILRNLTLDGVITDSIDIQGVQTTLKTGLIYGFTNNGCRNSVLVLNQCAFLGDESARWSNLTIRGFYNGVRSNCHLIYDSIIFGDFDLYNFNNNWTYYPVFRNSIFLKKRTVFKWNGEVIPVIWTAPGNEKQDIIESLTAYANDTLTAETEKNYLLNASVNLFGAGTLVYDDSPGNIRLFNGYDDLDNPIDLNLNMQNGNPALFSSSEGDYVGARRPAFKIEWDWANMQSIDEDGAVIDETPNLLMENNGIFVNVNSSQKRNRVKATQLLAFPAGDRLSRIAADFDSAADRGICFGAWQNETAGAFLLDACEAEVYDTPAQPSAYPRLLIPFNKDLEIACFKTGDREGEPLLFSDLEGLGVATNKNLTEVAGWAVTNGTAEFYGLIELEGIESRKPRFKYIRPVLTANVYS
jgi:hypothetical protein